MDGKETKQREFIHGFVERRARHRRIRRRRRRVF
jgi:hypothetical protein